MTISFSESLLAAAQWLGTAWIGTALIHAVSRLGCAMIEKHG